MGTFADKYYDAVRALAWPGDVSQRFPSAFLLIGGMHPDEIPQEVKSRHLALEKKASTSPQGKTVSYKEALGAMNEVQLIEIADEIVDLHDWAAQQEGRESAAEK